MDFFLKKEYPHLEHTIFPPKDRSETNEEHPQLRQILFGFITKIFKDSILIIFIKTYVKKSFKKYYDNENLLQ